MQGLLQFLLRNQSFFLFLLLEGIAFLAMVRFNAHHRHIFFTSANALSGALSERFDRVESFLKLDEEVDSLAEENAVLRAQLQRMQAWSGEDQSPLPPDTSRQVFSYLPARVISNSISRENNFLTLALPEGHGVEAGMGVVSRSGVVGIVQNASRRYASVMSLLHQQCHISASIHQKEVFGNLGWKGGDPTVLQLEDVPSHQKVGPGDVVQTSGYSFIFPPGIPIGVISDVRQPEGSYFYDIDVELANNMAGLQTVYIVQHQDLEELDSLRVQQY